MQLGIIGLGRMGGNISRRLMRAGHQTIVYDRSHEAVDALTKDGATASTGLGDMIHQLQKPRAIWVMLPAGAITEATVNELAGHLEPGDIIIDGGNSYYKDDIRRAKALQPQGPHLHRRRHLRRYLGPRARLLHDDRRRTRTSRRSASTPSSPPSPPAPATIEQAPPVATSRDPRVEQGYLHCGPAGSGPLRQDGP